MLFQIFEVLKSLPFRYNRDSRESKEAVATALQRYSTSIMEMQRLVTSMRINKERMIQAVLENYSLATDLADYMAAHFHLPYRYAYIIVGKVVDRAIQQNIKL